MANSRPVLAGFNLSVTFDEEAVNLAPQLIDADVTFGDADNNFDGGTLVLSGLAAGDILAIRNQGTGAGQIGLSGSDVTYEGTVIGTFAGGSDGGALSVIFNAQASSASIEALIQNLTYQNLSDTPVSARTLVLDITDAAGAHAVAPTPIQEVTGAANPFNGIDVGIYSKPALADLDGDGDLDAVVGDQTGVFKYFKNTGDSIAPAYAEQTGAANPLNGIDVGFNSASAFADLDGDGDLDAVLGPHDGTLRYFENFDNTDVTIAPVFVEQTGAANPFNGIDVGYSSLPDFADLDGDGDLDAVVAENDGVLNYFENTGSAVAPAYSTSAANPFDGIDVGAQSTASIVDLDGDGDLDALIGELDGIFNYFENTGTAVAPAYSTGAANPFNGIDTGFQSAPAFGDLDGDGDLDAVSGERYGALKYYENADAGAAPWYLQRVGAANPFNGIGMVVMGAPAFADFDGDGDLDAVIGALDGTLSRYFENTGTGVAPAYDVAGSASPFGALNVGGYSTPAFADLDGDGDLDAVVGRGGYGAYSGTLYYFKNTGTGVAPAYAVQTGSANPFNGIDVGLISTPAFADLDGDGDLDALIGELDGIFNYFENTGTAVAPVYVQQSGAADPFNGIDVGSSSAPAFADLDSDGDLDLVSGEFNGRLKYYENTGSAVAPAYVQRVGAANPLNLVNFGYPYYYSRPAFADLDGDGDLDLAVAWSIVETYYYENMGQSAGFSFNSTLNVTQHADPSEGADLMHGTGGADSIGALGGNDTVMAGAGNDTLDGGSGDDSLAGGTDIDTASYASAGAGVTVSLAAQGAGQNTGGAGNDTLTGFENLTGSGFDDTLTGDASANRLDGGAGGDNLGGGVGDDVYFLDDIGDFVGEIDGEGQDTVFSSVSVGGVNSALISPSIEFVTLTGTDPINAISTASTLVVNGNNAANIIYGGANATMAGGGGDDQYFVTAAGQVVIEALSGGSDTINLSVDNWTLPAGSEVELVLDSGDAHYVTGNELANKLDGGGGNDTLVGGGGNDTLYGGSGDDLYIVDETGDTQQETFGQGIDTVQASVDYTLPFTAVDTLILMGSGNLDGSGNVLDNLVVGNAGNNSLYGGDFLDPVPGNDTLLGGAGNDTLDGGPGDDSLVGGADTDMASYFSAGAGVTVSLAAQGAGQNTGGAGNDTLTGFENLTGSGFNDTLTGDAGANVLNGGAGNDSLAGGGDTDTASYASAGAGVTVSLAAQGAGQNTGGAGNDTLTGFENLSGSGFNDTLTGDTVANTLDGGEGNDVLTGGGGNDLYVVDSAGDVVSEGAGAGGVDTVQSAVSFSIAALGNIERVTLTGSNPINATGNALFNALTGNSVGNVLDGGDGADLLDGGAGDDTLIGGLGNDAFVVDSNLDVITELAGGGYDTANSTAPTYTLGAEVERLVLVAGAGAISGTGNALFNVLNGNESNNVLDAGVNSDLLDGGGGNDTMYGGADNDTYIVDSTGDMAQESVGGGFDTVQSTAPSFTLGANVERLNLTGSANINGTGNDEINTILGNTGNNELRGDDGADTINGAGGTDSMYGGLGNDRYFVDGTTEVASENPSEGFDVVQSTASYTITDNIEQLLLVGAAANGTGNPSPNTITGNDSNNFLSGLGAADTLLGGPADTSVGADTLDGGIGNDSMIGGGGNDLYFVDAAGDQVVDSAGFDTVISTLATGYTLGVTIENLTLAGVGNINGTGNTLADTLQGNSDINSLNGDVGADTIDGGGGADTLLGGVGNDSLQWDATDARVDGGADFDTLWIFGHGTTLDLTGVAGVKLINAEIINLDNVTVGSDNTLELQLSEILSLAPTGNALRVDGNAGDTANASDVGSWTQITDQTIGANTYHRWTNSTITLLIDNDVSTNLPIA